MTSETAKVESRLSALASSFDDLEDLLEPLFAQSLPETVTALELIQQAKLQTVLPYIVYDLIFIYLKTRGVDPKGHPVISELDRIRQYFEKIANAEKSQDKPGTKLDKDAAGRFIKHAIARFSKQSDQTEPTPPSIFVPVKVTSKMAARAEYERELKEQSAQLSDEELQVFNDSGEDDDGSSIDIDEPSMESTDPALGNFDSNDQLQSNLKKRKRPSVDPFAGYGDEISTSANGSKFHDTSHSESAMTIDDKTNTSANDELSSQHFSPSRRQRDKKNTVKQQTS